MRKLALATAVFLLLLQANPAAAAATLTQVPYPIDSSNQAAWWSPLETYVGGNQYAYMAFNEPGSVAGKHKVAIARRDGSGNWTKLPVMNGAAQAEYDDDIGHNQPSIARDGSGRFHVFASMHNNPWRYFRSDVAGGNPQIHSGDLPDQNIGVTYPVVTTAPNGDVYMMARLNGAGAKPGKLYRWNNAASTWSLVDTIAEIANRSFYPDDLQFDSAGNLHILWEWGLYPSSGYRHELSYAKYLPASGTFVDQAVIQPMTAGEVYGDDTSTGPAVQSAKLTLDGTSPKVAYRYRQPTNFDVWYAYVSGGSWVRDLVYSGGQTKAALDITWHPTEAKRIYYATASGTDRVFAATKPGAAWVSASVAPGLPIERLSVERDSTGVDVLYLVDITNLRLYYGRN